MITSQKRRRWVAWQATFGRAGNRDVNGKGYGIVVSSGTGMGHEVGLGGIIDDTFLVDL